uniref:Uncharacterized protein n=1 Tax=Anguilla anguilla TaxID=7936 RepID=A0A0E9WQT5_ANGAN
MFVSTQMCCVFFHSCKFRKMITSHHARRQHLGKD